MKRIALALAGLAILPALASCTSQADTVSANLSKDADSFKIERQIVFYNGITGDYIAEVTGLCSIGNDNTARRMSYTCKVGPGNSEQDYIKNYLGLSDNVSWFALQTKAVPEDPWRYKVIFKPEEVIPNVDLQTSGNSN